MERSGAVMQNCERLIKITYTVRHERLGTFESGRNNVLERIVESFHVHVSESKETMFGMSCINNSVYLQSLMPHEMKKIFKM